MNLNHDVYLLCKGDQQATFERAKWKAWLRATNDGSFVYMDSAKCKQTAEFIGCSNECGQYEKYVIVNVTFNESIVVSG